MWTHKYAYSSNCKQCPYGISGEAAQAVREVSSYTYRQNKGIYLI